MLLDTKFNVDMQSIMFTGKLFKNIIKNKFIFKYFS